jgi:cellulose/xylan binding protein with CBM9 domain/PHP domain-containing protein
MLYLEEEKLLMLKGDMHIHTEYSDGDVLNKVLANALNYGLDFIAIADHDTCKGIKIARDTLKEMNMSMKVLAGNEVTGPGCHLLAYGIEADIPNLGGIKGISDAVHEKGGYLCAAHPYWTRTKKSFWDSELFHNAVYDKLVDGIELINYAANLDEDGNDAPGNLPVIDFYEKLKTNGQIIPITVGSDAHYAEQIGHVCVYVFSEDDSEKSTLDAIFEKNMSVAFWRGNVYGSEEALALWEKHSAKFAEVEQETIASRLKACQELERKSLEAMNSTTISCFSGTSLKPDLSPPFPVLRISQKDDEKIFLTSYQLKDEIRDDDVKVSFSVFYDNEYLNVRIFVKDNFFYQPYCDSSAYMGDSIQIGFDPLCRRSKFSLKEKNIFEFLLANTEDGPIVINNLVPELCKNKISAELLVTQKDNMYTYDFKVPMKSLQIKSDKGRAVGFNLIVNVNDGNGRRGWIEWTPGIGDRKSADDWGCLVFE